MELELGSLLGREVKLHIPAEGLEVKEDSQYVTFHFSQSNPHGVGQQNVPALLRRVASTIEELGDITVHDLVLHSEMTSDGEDWPSITVYYAEN